MKSSFTIGSLFSGIGGLELGLEIAIPGARVVWQAEKDPYAYNVLAHHWPKAVRYRDVRLIDESAPRVDVICGGFPCQDISVAGKGAGLAGKRSGLWREFARVIRILRPSLVFVENVAALRRRGLDVVLGELAALRFDADWTTVRASDVGAPHIRERLFLLAHSDRGELRQLAERIEQRPAERGESQPREHGEGDVADADSERRLGLGLGLGLAESPGLESARRSEPDGRSNGGGRDHVFPPGPAAIAGWTGPQPAIRRSHAGLFGRVDRLRCLGNAVIPAQADLAFRTLLTQALDGLVLEAA